MKGTEWRVVCAVFWLGGGIACGGMSREEARQAFQTLDFLMLSGSSGANASRNGLMAALSDGVEVDFPFDCPYGGKAHFVGTVNEQLEFDYAVTLEECAEDGIQVSGSVTYEMSAAEETGTYLYQTEGRPEFDGDIGGDCRVDVSMTLHGLSSDELLTYCGTICGHDAGKTMGSPGDDC